MARHKDFMPQVPLHYRGVAVSEYVAYRWEDKEAHLWRLGVDNAIEEVLQTLAERIKRVEEGSGSLYYSDWDDGAQYGREDALDDLSLDMNKYREL